MMKRMMEDPVRVPPATRSAVLVVATVLFGCEPYIDAMGKKGKGGEAPETTPISEAGVPGTFSVELQHDGRSRSAIVYVPASYDPSGSTALMLNFHGYGGTAADHMMWADMRDLAEQDGFIVAYPQGTRLDGAPHWNAALPGGDNKSDADDLGFVRALLDELGQTHPFDADRVYATGFSNGGMMAAALACYTSDLVAAVGVVSGQQLDTGRACAPEHPTAFISLHGTEDGVLPYHGNAEGFSAQEAIDFWVDFNETSTTPVIEQSRAGGMTIEREVYSGGRHGVAVEHYRYVGGDHVWFEAEYDGADASELVWEFLIQFDRNGAR